MTLNGIQLFWRTAFLVAFLVFSSSLSTFAATAAFVGTDASTEGSWKGVYGGDGYNVIGDSSGSNPSYPGYATVSANGSSSHTWVGTTFAEPALLATPSGSVNRIAACLYSFTSFTIDVNLTDGNTHQVALYLMDWDNQGRSESISISDAQTNSVLDSRSALSFVSGVYYVWNINGHVKFTITSTAGPNAVVSGLFFGAGSGSTVPSAPTNLSASYVSGGVSLTWTAGTGATSYNVYRGTTSGGESTTPIAAGVSGTTYSDSAVTPAQTYYYQVVAVNSTGGSPASNEVSQTIPNPASVAFVKTDTSTQGSWKGVYGGDGFNVSADTSIGNPTYPTYASVVSQNVNTVTWGATQLARALLTAQSGSTTRIASATYSNSGTSFTLDINFKDGNTHQIAFYLLDWYNQGRVETISISDYLTNSVLDSRSASNFQNGVYYVYNIKGHVVVTFTATTGVNAVVSGIFFGPGSGGTVPPSPTNVTAKPGSGLITLSWNASASATSYSVFRASTSGQESYIGAYKNGITGTTFIDTGLTPGSTYYYEVMAVNAVGGSGLSSEASATISTTAETFLNADSSTQGAWKGVYGADGYNVVNDTSGNNPSYPGYAGISVSGDGVYTWNGNTPASEALLTAASGSTKRIAACYYASSNLTIDVNVTDGKSHQIALYLLDWDHQGRSETITITDASTNTVLDTRTASSFSKGVYYVYSISGHVKITLSPSSGPNAVVSGLFFGGGSGSTVPAAPTKLVANWQGSQVALSWTASSGAVSYNLYRGTYAGGESSTPIATGLTGTTYTDTAVTPGATYVYAAMAVNAVGGSNLSAEASTTAGTATFVKTDTSTQGSWKGVYGAGGFNVVKDSDGNNPTYPAYVAVSVSGNGSAIWNWSTTAVQALQMTGSATTQRIAACWYSPGSFTIDINITDGKSHQIAFYLLDWDSKSRVETVSIADAGTGNVLDSRSASGFSGGIYYVYNISGHVQVTFAGVSGPNAVVSGLFFGL